MPLLFQSGSTRKADDMIEQFRQYLVEATARIPAHYFQLPVAEKEEPIYRERVYCYELYHQLRTLLEKDKSLAHYALSGEVDKQGHPIIRRSMPDFIFHEPGDMDYNLVAIEVKPSNADEQGIRKDLETLAYFVSPEVGYRLGVELVYGDNEKKLARFEEKIRATSNDRLQLYWHRYSGGAAIRVA